jgi:LysM repeat protein
MPEICPFLAASHDPDSVLNYPSAANVCTKLGEAQPVANDHQAGYCLRARHWFCPVYTGTIKQPPIPIQIESEAEVTVSRLPRESRDVRQRQLRRMRERRLFIGFLIVVLGGGSIYGSAKFLSGQRQSAITPSTVPALSSETALATNLAISTTTITATPMANNTQPGVLTVTEAVTTTFTGTVTPTMSITLSASPSSTMTATATASSTSSATNTATTASTITPTPKACEVPFGWQHYTVSAGETYFRIAVKFGTSVDALQRVNCLVAPERLLAGQVINVPPTPGK